MIMAAYQWRTKQNQHKYKKILQSGIAVHDHPLKPIINSVTETKLFRVVGRTRTSSATSSVPGTPARLTLTDPLSLALEGLDPLSQFSKEEKLDPLSKFAAEAQENHVNGSYTNMKRSKEMMNSDCFEPWSAKRASILNKFTTSEKLSITTSFLSGGEKVVIKTQSSVMDKVKHRLEQLDDFEEGSVREMLNLSQQEYVHRIEQLNHELVQAWNVDQRVKALKIVIQCSKLLVDTSVIQFYPSKFVLLTDILDTFGKLVYERLKNKAENLKPDSTVPINLPNSFTPEMVPESAKETCRNWFYKIASIRELVPRLYVEIAILKSYMFLCQDMYDVILLRLTKTIRGIGNPLVSVYARTYLCRVGMMVAPHERQYLQQNLTDFMVTYKKVSIEGRESDIVYQKVSLSTYLSLFIPALDWMLHCIAFQATEILFQDIVIQCKNQCNSALLLNSIMAAFKPDYIANHALQLVEMISLTSEEGFSHHQLFCTLGLCMVVVDPPKNHRLQILNDVWRFVGRLHLTTQYVNCAEVWIQFIVRHFGEREVNTFLSDILKHVMPDRAFESHYPQLQSIIERVIAEMHDFNLLLSMDKFLPFIDIFGKESVKVDVCKNLMDSFNRHQTDSVSDPVLINEFMYICKIMHDSVSSLIVEDEKRQISNLICGYVKRVNFGRDFEQQLSFYMEARAAFTKLDTVLVQLIHCVNKLSVETGSIVGGHHTRKTSAFVRACAAYCFITIPSLSSILSKLELYVLSGQVNLLNHCLSQADASFKASISLVLEVPKFVDLEGKQKSSEPFLISFLSNFLSALLIVPDSPQQGVMYMIRGFLNAVDMYPWEPSGGAKATIHLRVLQVLCVTLEQDYPYHVYGVDSNDSLYVGDESLQFHVNAMCTAVLEILLAELKQLGETEQLKKQAQIAFELFCMLAIYGDLQNGQLARLANNLWTLAHKNSLIDKRQGIQTLEYMKKKGSECGEGHLLELLSRLQIGWK